MCSSDLKLTSRDPEFVISTYTCSAVFYAALLDERWSTLSDIDPVTLHPITRHLSEHTYGVIDTRPAPIEDFTHSPLPPAGSIGRLSVISFGATKPLAAGAGGAVLGPKDAIEDIRDRRDYDGKRDLRERFNFQMSDLHAALGRTKLKRLDSDRARRAEIAERYLKALRPVAYTPRGFWYRFPIMAERGLSAQQLILVLAGYGIQAIAPVEPWELLHRKLGHAFSRYSNAEMIASRAVSLPVWPGMSEAEIGQVCSALEKL